MALDRFVKFSKKRHPSKQEVETVLKNFFGSSADVFWNDKTGRFFATLPGTCTFTFEGIEGAASDPFAGEERKRWIEVFYDGSVPYLDVITRSHDEFTNALAHRLAEVFARFWGGEYGDD